MMGEEEVEETQAVAHPSSSGCERYLKPRKGEIKGKGLNDLGPYVDAAVYLINGHT